MGKSFVNLFLAKRNLFERILFALFLLTPWLEFKGHALLRFDLKSFTLHLFGAKFVLDNLYLILLLLAGLSALFMSLSMLFGRLWCGWFCPQTLICDLTEPYKSSPLIFYPLIGVLSLILTSTVYFYFRSPYEVLAALFSATSSAHIPYFWLSLLFLLTFLNFAFYRRGFCKDLCLTAWIQKLGLDEYSLRIVFAKERSSDCRDCKACIKVCPFFIDLRNNFDKGCISCAKCLLVCERIMKTQGKASLFSFGFGEGKRFSIRYLLRTNILLTGLLALFLFLFVPLYHKFQSELKISSYIKTEIVTENSTKRPRKQLVIKVENQSKKEERIVVKFSPSVDTEIREIRLAPLSRKTLFFDLPERPNQSKPLKVVVENSEGRQLFERKIAN